MTDVRLDYAGGRSDHRVSNLTLNAMGHAIALRGTIDAQAPFALDAAVTAVRREKPQGVVYATIDGNLTELAIDGGGRKPLNRIVLRPAARMP